MTDRIDHTQEALGHLVGWDTEGHWEGDVASAQVHATLALVEQQRIANLIALRQWGAGSMHLVEIESREFIDVRPQIREGLGL